jgi:hypothetical protein
MLNITVAAESAASPERVLALAGTDFSGHRARVWGNVKESRLAVHERGATHVEVTEHGTLRLVRARPDPADGHRLERAPAGLHLQPPRGPARVALVSPPGLEGGGGALATSTRRRRWSENWIIAQAIQSVAIFANREYHSPVLKPQDLVVAVRLAIPSTDHSTYPNLAASLRMSASEAHAAVKRAAECGLVDGTTRRAKRSALLEFVVHGLRYVFPPSWSGVSRGIPTSYAAPPLSVSIVQGDLPPVWPHPEGQTRGQGLRPIYKSIPDASLRDAELYKWMALLDAIRSGRARERELAVGLIRKRLT